MVMEAQLEPITMKVRHVLSSDSDMHALKLRIHYFDGPVIIYKLWTTLLESPNQVRRCTNGKTKAQNILNKLS